MALTPDFDTYPVEFALSSVEIYSTHIEVGWSDGRVSRFHHSWLRDNCPCAQCVHQITKEQMFELVTVSADVHPTGAGIDPEGALALTWSEAGHPNEIHHSQIHPGWLRANCYGDEARRERRNGQITWDASTFDAPPTFDGAAIIADDSALLDWLNSLHSYGV